MSSSFSKLIQIMTQLRNPGGCPWDHKQTHDSLKPYLIEEAYEVLDAIDQKNYPHLCEELGDLLLQIIFHSQIANERGDFNINDVIQSISEKLIRRHPHVFGKTSVKNADEVVKNWDQIKSEEKKFHQTDSLLNSVPQSLPALFQAYKLTKKAAKVGFDWEKTEDVILKIEEEINELKEACQKKNHEEMFHELGDIFLALANLSRFLDIHPEEALRSSNQRFRKRFQWMEKMIAEQGKKSDTLSLTEWDQLWEKAKKKTQCT